MQDNHQYQQIPNKFNWSSESPLLRIKSPFYDSDKQLRNKEISSFEEKTLIKSDLISPLDFTISPQTLDRGLSRSYLRNDHDIKSIDLKDENETTRKGLNDRNDESQNQVEKKVIFSELNKENKLPSLQNVQSSPSELVLHDPTERANLFSIVMEKIIRLNSVRTTKTKSALNYIIRRFKGISLLDANDYPITKRQLYILQDHSLKYIYTFKKKLNLLTNLPENDLEIKDNKKTQKTLAKKIQELCINRCKKQDQKSQLPIKTRIFGKFSCLILCHNTIIITLENFMELLKINFSPTSSSLILRPDSKIRILWDTICITVISYQLIIIPFQLAFDYQLAQELTNFNFICDIYFILDIFLSLNTGYDDDCGIVMDRKKIIKHYFKGWFWIDLIPSFPYAWLDNVTINTGVSPNSTNSNTKLGLLRAFTILKFLKILRMIAVLKLTKIFKKFDNLLKSSLKISGIFGLLELCITIMCLAHWLGCAWHYLGASEINFVSTTWLSNQEISNDLLEVRYITSIYWAITTMITLGYGDFIPMTTAERVLAIFAMIMSCCVFACVINRMRIFIDQIDFTEFAFRSHMLNFTTQLRKKSINPELMSRIKRYMEHYFEEQKSFNPEETKIIMMLSQSLKVELITEISTQHISKIPFLRKNFSKAFLESVAYIARELKVGPSEEIWTEDLDDKSLYYIYHGNISMHIKGFEAAAKVLKTGDYFGEIAFFTGLNRSAYGISIEYSRLLKISRDDFLRVLEEFPSDKEKFFMIKDTILIYGNYEDLGLRCYSCRNPNHLVANCSVLHFVKDKEYVLNQYHSRKNQFCIEFVRKNRRVCHSYSKIREDIRLIHQNHKTTLAQLEKSSMKRKSYDSPKQDQSLLQINPDQNPPALFKQKLATIIKRRLDLRLTKVEAQKSLTAKDEHEEEKPKGRMTRGITYNIDKIQNYKTYFPHNNAAHIIQLIQNGDDPVQPANPRVSFFEKVEQQYENFMFEFYGKKALKPPINFTHGLISHSYPNLNQHLHQSYDRRDSKKSLDFHSLNDIKTGKKPKSASMHESKQVLEVDERCEVPKDSPKSKDMNEVEEESKMNMKYKSRMKRDEVDEENNIPQTKRLDSFIDGMEMMSFDSDIYEDNKELRDSDNRSMIQNRVLLLNSPFSN